MKHLYFVRHGLSEMNVRYQRSGHTDTPLHPDGHEQAKSAGKALKEQGLSFDIIISSPLQRAHHTAKHIATHIEYPHEQILLDERLMERNFGSLEGKKDTPIITAGLLLNEAYIDKYEGVEQLEDLQGRANEMLAHLHSLDHETVLVVSHGAFGRALYRAVNDIPIHKYSVRYKNAEVTKLI